MQTTSRMAYENIEFNVTTGQTAYNLASNQATFLGRAFGINDQPLPTQVRISTNYTITVKLNTTDDHAITVTSTESPFYIKGVQIKNMFIANSSGNTAAVKLLFTDVEN